MSVKKWSDDYPKDIDIPPAEAAEIDANLFRLVYKADPDADDFLASFKDPKQRHLVKQARFRNSPNFYATSFFQKYESIKGLLDGSPERFAGHLIACGDVKPEHGMGVLIQEKPHVSIWLYEGIYPKGFKIV